MKGRHLIFNDFINLLALILYGDAIKDVFDHLTWSPTGVAVFVGLLSTIIRYFLGNQIIEAKFGHQIIKKNFFAYICFWLNLAMAGTITLLANEQQDDKLIYLLILLIVVDLIWCGKSYYFFRHCQQAKYYVLNRLVTNITLISFFIIIFLFFPHIEINTQMEEQLSWLISIALFSVAVIDFILNNNLYLTAEEKVYSMGDQEK